MRYFIAFTLALFLAACDTPRPASPILGDVIAAIVTELNADKGERMDGGVILDGARAQGNTVVASFILTEHVEDLRTLPRETRDAVFSAFIRREACADANMSVFFGLGGRLQFDFLAPNRELLSSAAIDRC